MIKFLALKIAKFLAFKCLSLAKEEIEDFFDEKAKAEKVKAKVTKTKEQTIKKQEKKETKESLNKQYTTNKKKI